MSPPLSQLFLVRLSGEVSTKARATHARFVRRVRKNLEDALAAGGGGGRVRTTRSRLFVETPAPGIGDALARVFGVQSISPVERRTEPSLEAIVEAGEELFRERVRGRRFAVRARRVGDRTRIPLSAREVEQVLGAALLPHALGVDLDTPEFTARVEILAEEAYLFAERANGPGGLPLGVEGRALGLVSGGFDSAVAAWHLQKRGVALDFAFCNLGGATHELGVLRVIKCIADDWSYGTRPRLHAIDFQPLAAELQARTKRRYWQVLLKRLMLRAATAVAREIGARALITGDAVGQVSSQTLTNLGVISRATELPILRPLVGANKNDIIADATRIGTYELSAAVGEYCAMVSGRPATAASLAAIETEEAKLDPGLVARAVAERTELDLRGLDAEKLGLPELEVEAIPDGATVLDLRSRTAYRGWHYPGALHLDFARALDTYRSFERGRTYVSYCEFGLKSAHLAERMRQEGLEAYHFRGGLKALLRWTERKGLVSRDLLGL